MNYKKKARIINAIIENIQGGIISMEKCLVEYPDLAGEIQSAFSTIDIISSISFSEEEEIEPRIQKINLLQKLPDREEFVTKHMDHRYRLQNLKRRFVMTWIVIVTTILSLISGAGAVYASNDALPGDVLYPVKMWTEDVQLAIAPDNVDKDLYIQFANKRIEEAVKLIQAGRFEDLDETAAGYQQRTELLTQTMLRIQAEDPDEAIKFRLDLEEKLREQARIMQSFVVDEGDGSHLQEQVRLMLEANTKLRLRINEVEEVPVDETEGLGDDAETPLDGTALKANEGNDEAENNKVGAPSLQVNNENGTLIFGLGGKGVNGVYAEVNGLKYECVVDSDTAVCGMQGVPQKGNVNLYDPQTNQLLYSYSYEYEHAFDYELEGEKNDNGNNSELKKNDESGKDTSKNGKGN